MRIPAYCLNAQLISVLVFNFNFNFNRGTRQNPLDRHLDKVLVFSLARRQSHQSLKFLFIVLNKKFNMYIHCTVLG